MVWVRRRHTIASENSPIVGTDVTERERERERELRKKTTTGGLLLLMMRVVTVADLLMRLPSPMLLFSFYPHEFAYHELAFACRHYC